ncbi:MAG: carboxymuconolactone decarboxylase family protein, partial [Nitrospinota bacterium]
MAEEAGYNPVALRRGALNFGEEYARRVLDRMNSIDREFSRLFQDYVYAGMYEREVIDHKTRELCAVAGLTALGRFPQLRSHFRASLNYGARPEELREVILQMTIYAGFPVALQALNE